VTEAAFDFIAYQGKKKQPVVVDIPNLQGAPLIETHAHLDMLENPASALARAAYVGITDVLTLTNLSRAEQTFEMLDVWREGAQLLIGAHCAIDAADEASTPSATQLPNIHVMAGVHPHDARNYDKRIEKQLTKLAGNSRIVAIGEAGLDYYYDHSPRDVQRKVFARNLELANELDLPIIVHLRDAHDEGLRILSEVGVPKAGAVLHCYNREPSIAEPFLKMGCTLGFGGPVTFKSAHEVKDAAAAAPTGSIVVETDCPFMAPTPFRGQKCEPAHTLWVADEIAKLRNMTLPEFAQETTDTAKRIFKLP